MQDTIGWCAGQGVHVFDFTIGDEPYKNTFRPESWPVFEIIQPNSWKGWLVTRVLAFDRKAEVFWHKLKTRFNATVR